MKVSSAAMTVARLQRTMDGRGVTVSAGALLAAEILDGLGAGGVGSSSTVSESLFGSSTGD